MFSRKAFAFVASPAGRRAFHSALAVAAKPGQAEVILVGCGAPNRGMGWYHGIQVCDTWGGMNNCNKGGGEAPWFLYWSDHDHSSLHVRLGLRNASTLNVASCQNSNPTMRRPYPAACYDLVVDHVTNSTMFLVYHRCWKEGKNKRAHYGCSRRKHWNAMRSLVV